jgi:rubredoxin
LQIRAVIKKLLLFKPLQAILSGFFSDKGYIVESKSYMCVVCGFIYHEEDGYPDDHISPNTAWEDVPDGWVCPECKVGKDQFVVVD